MKKQKTSQDCIAITVMGKDRKGIIAGISNELAKNGVNIIDIQQNVLHGMFSMFMVAEIKGPDLTLVKIKKILRKKEKALEIGVEKLGEHRKKKEKELYVIVVLARDRVGIVADISSILFELGINIEKTSLTARGDLISIEFVADFYGLDAEKVKEEIKRRAERVGLDVIISKYSSFRREKKLVVFDMDSTVVEQEIIDAIAKEAGVEKEVKEITAKAMRGEMEFKDALKQRVRLLKGMRVETLESIAGSISLTPGIEELMDSLKAMSYKTALVTGGFTYFANRIGEKLKFDYVFGNELVIENGVLTGEVKEPIIDAEAKGRIIIELAKKENISRDNIVAIGDGANDRIMIKNAGLGIAFNAKELLKKISDGTLSRQNILGVLNILKRDE